MKIQYVESATGLDRPSIRFYEKEGLLTPKRLENGYRDYSDDDVELLKKIKLLRRLGMSVEKIRALQQGSADLNSAIAQQMRFHTSQIDEHRRCRAVCEAMRQDGAEFASLNADHYLRLLREIRIDDKVLLKSSFSENIPKEIHPWRRYFARWMDYLLWGALIEFVLFAVFRIRPLPGKFVEMLLSIAIAASFVPVESLMLWKFGTTPGKFIMGIRIAYYQGGNLPFAEALERSTQVFIQGTGCALPLVSVFAYLTRFCQLTGRSFRIFPKYDEVQGPQDMDWDYQSELIYEEGNWKRAVAAVAALAVFLTLSAVTVLDFLKPKYRGAELTVAEVAANYNATVRMLQRDAQYYDELQEDGSKKQVASNTVIFDMNNSSGNNQMQFSYDVQDGMVRSVQVSHSWDSVFWLQPVQGDALVMAYSLLLAQDNCGYRELREFAKLYESYLNQKEAAFAYGNLLVEWRIETEKEMIDGVIYGDNEENVKVVLDFQITIQ